MKVAIAVILNSTIAFTFVLSQAAFASSEIFQRAWNDSSGIHTLTIDKKLDSKERRRGRERSSKVRFLNSYSCVYQSVVNQ